MKSFDALTSNQELEVLQLLTDLNLTNHSMRNLSQPYNKFYYLTFTAINEESYLSVEYK